MSPNLAAELGICTPEDLAPLFGCTPAHIEQRLANRQLPGVKVGRGWTLQTDALRQHLAAEALANVTPTAPPVPATKPAPALRGKRKELHP